MVNKNFIHSVIYSSIIGHPVLLITAHILPPSSMYEYGLCVCLSASNKRQNAEPIRPKVVNALYMNPGRSKEYGWSKFQILPENNLAMIIFEITQI